MNKQELMQRLHEMMDQGQDLKQLMVEEAHTQWDLMPCLWYMGEKGSESVFATNTCPLHDHEPAEVLSARIVEQYPECGKPKLLIFGTEGYMDIADKDHNLSVELRRGALGEDFANNPATHVSEVVLLTACQDDLVGGTEMVQVIAPFTYDDGLRIQWAERQEHGLDDEHEIAGAIADVLTAAFQIPDEEWTTIVAQRLRDAIVEDIAREFTPMRGMAIQHTDGWAVNTDSGWVDCEDAEITEELVQIENNGLDVTESIKTLFGEMDPEFASHIERADLVWDGGKSFGIGIRMTEPGYMESPPDVDLLLPRLIHMMRQTAEFDGLENIPQRKGIFDAMQAFDFSQEIENTLGREEGNEHDGRP